MTAPYTLLLTDLVDSTRLTRELGDAWMAEVWEAHDRVARDLLAEHGGREIDKTDGFLFLFEQPLAAVAYALAYHRALRALSEQLGVPLSARAGIHRGPVVLRRADARAIARGAKPLEVDGLAKPTAARVMSVAVGGQTLLSADARAALPDHDATSHGHWRLKGLDEPIELFEVGDEHAPFTPPPDGDKAMRVVREGELWLPVRAIERALPAEPDRFVGRAADLRAVVDQLSRVRLLTLLGPGGTGKTRLALRYAWTRLADYPGGVWMCDLTEARTADDIAAAVARALGVPLGRGDLVPQLGHALAARGRCLVVLDNFEQVVEHAEPTLGAWMKRAVDARWLVTSRQVLGLPGEHTRPLDPLGEVEGAELFVERARAAKPDFEPDEHVDDLVALLDGLPLAIELAAARVRVMRVEQIAARMTDRFRVLASGGRGRHATLRATLDTSWELLSDDERSALAQLSVFEGGFTLEAAEQVLELETSWPVDAVQELVAKSLVRGGDRFRLLASIQEYARERLEDAEAVECRHGAWCAGLKPHVDELDNLESACRRAAARGDAEVAARTALGAWRKLQWIGPYARGIALLDLARDLDLPEPLRVDIWLASAKGARETGDFEAARRWTDLALATASDPGRRALALIAHATLLKRDGARADAEAAYREALTEARQTGSSDLIGSATLQLGIFLRGLGVLDEARALLETAAATHTATTDRELARVHLERGEPDAARQYAERAVERARQLRDLSGEAAALHTLGSVLDELGDDGALETLRRAEELHRRTGRRRNQGETLANIALWLDGAGKPEASRAAYEEALGIHREVRNARAEGIVLMNLADLDLCEGALDRARERLHAAREHLEATGFRYGLGYLYRYLADLARHEGRLDEALELAHRGLDAARPFPTVQMHPLLGLVRAHLARGELDQARARIEEARRFDHAQVHAIDAMVAHAEGDEPRARSALGQARQKAGKKTRTRTLVAEAAALVEGS